MVQTSKDGNNDKVSYDTFFLFLGCLRNESFGYIILSLTARKEIKWSNASIMESVKQFVQCMYFGVYNDGMRRYSE